jgi:hypothetical protein
LPCRQSEPAGPVSKAISWADEDGLEPDRDALTRLFTTAEADPFAEDLFLDLLTALGIPAET